MISLFFLFLEYSKYLSKQPQALSCAVSNRAVVSGTIQVNSYLDEPIVPFDSLKNPIHFWRNRPDCEIKELALKYLIITTTSVPSEHTASAAGNTITNRRTNLTPEHAKELVFLNKNSYLLDL